MIVLVAWEQRVVVGSSLLLPKRVVNTFNHHQEWFPKCILSCWVHTPQCFKIVKNKVTFLYVVNIPKIARLTISALLAPLLERIKWIYHLALYFWTQCIAVSRLEETTNDFLFFLSLSVVVKSFLISQRRQQHKVKSASWPHTLFLRAPAVCTYA